jgi:hypothetical protein
MFILSEYYEHYPCLHKSYVFYDILINLKWKSASLLHGEKRAWPEVKVSTEDWGFIALNHSSLIKYLQRF